MEYASRTEASRCSLSLREREREREVSLKINKGLKVGKHNAMSGDTERGRERQIERDFEAIESQLALRRLYTRHKSRTSSHLPLPPPLCTRSPRSLLHHLWPSRPDRGPQTHITPPLVTNGIAIRHKHVQDTSRSTDVFFHFRSSISELVDGAAVCVCVCARARARACVGSIGRRYRG